MSGTKTDGLVAVAIVISLLAGGAAGFALSETRTLEERVYALEELNIKNNLDSIRSDIEFIIYDCCIWYEERLDSLESAGFGDLIYDSGWIAIDQDETRVICTLDDPDVFVYMIGRAYWWEDWWGGAVIHQYQFGGDTLLIDDTIIEEGAVWYIDYQNKLTVMRYWHDDLWVDIRVLVWKLF